LRGVEKALALGPACEGNAYRTAGADRVPATLGDAIELADKSPITRELLSPAFIDNLLAIARFELGVFERTVTDLEMRRYFEMA
jgi:glutamine synthetase